MISESSGQYLVKLARKAIETYLNEGVKIEVPEDCPDELKEKLGVFVTLNKNEMLRGCIGYPEPVERAVDATINVAISAAFQDPRFNPLRKEEYDDITLEVTVLTKPELLEVNENKEYLDKIKIGRDGLIVQKGFSKGLLLPQVATENNMDVKEFLEHTCMKADISTDSWLDMSCDIYTFQGQIFK